MFVSALITSVRLFMRLMCPELMRYPTLTRQLLLLNLFVLLLLKNLMSLTQLRFSWEREMLLEFSRVPLGDLIQGKRDLPHVPAHTIHNFNNKDNL